MMQVRIPPSTRTTPGRLKLVLIHCVSISVASESFSTANTVPALVAPTSTRSTASPRVISIASLATIVDNGINFQPTPVTTFIVETPTTASPSPQANDPKADTAVATQDTGVTTVQTTQHVAATSPTPVSSTGPSTVVVVQTIGAEDNATDVSGMVDSPNHGRSRDATSGMSIWIMMLVGLVGAVANLA